MLGNKTKKKLKTKFVRLEDVLLKIIIESHIVVII